MSLLINPTTTDYTYH